MAPRANLAAPGYLSEQYDADRRCLVHARGVHAVADLGDYGLRHVWAVCEKHLPGSGRSSLLLEHAGHDGQVLLAETLINGLLPFVSQAGEGGEPVIVGRLEGTLRTQTGPALIRGRNSQTCMLCRRERTTSSVAGSGLGVADMLGGLLTFARLRRSSTGGCRSDAIVWLIAAGLADGLLREGGGVVRAGGGRTQAR